MKDDGVVEATVLFAQGETSRTLFGYAPIQPSVSATSGTAGVPSYDENSHLFRVEVTPGGEGFAVITIR